MRLIYKAAANLKLKHKTVSYPCTVLYLANSHALTMCHMPVDQKHHLLHTGQFHWHEMTHNSELLVW